MNNIETFFHAIHSDTFVTYWLFYLGYLFIVAYFGWSKLFRHAATVQKPGISLFETITGWLELLGALALFIGLFYPPMTLVPLIWLFPISLITLLRRKGEPHYAQFYNLLYTCIIPVLLVIMNRSYGIIKIA